MKKDVAFLFWIFTFPAILGGIFAGIYFLGCKNCGEKSFLLGIIVLVLVLFYFGFRLFLLYKKP